MSLPESLNDRQHRSYRQDPNNENQSVVATLDLGGFGIDSYDYIAGSQTTSSDTFIYKSGGASGTTVATVVIQYTDSTKSDISSVEKT